MSLVERVVEKVVRLLPDKPADPLIAAHGAIGQPLPRLDGPAKVTGAARFTAEVVLERMAYAALVCSTIAKGRIEHIDIGDAERAPGVVAVVTHRNAPKMKAPPRMFADRKSASTSDLPVMQDAQVHWNGQPVAVVVAETQDEADHAASLVRVTYAASPADLSFDALRPKARHRRTSSASRRRSRSATPRRR